jgi:uncharacterized protein (DUF2141 family)
MKSPVLALTILGAASTGLAAAQTPAAGAKVTVTVHDVVGQAGIIRALLCADPSTFGNNCKGINATAPAKDGSVDVVFTGVPKGVYALVVYHYTDSDGRFSIVAEPMAFGNEARELPPVFDTASLKVDGDLRTATSLFRFGQ